MLTPFDKQRRLQTSEDFLELVGDNIDKICDRIVTVDKPGHERQSYRSDVGSYRAECCFTRQCICPHGAGFEAALKDTGFSEIDHPPYSPDLAPATIFFQFKKELRGRRFVDDNQMKMAVESHFDCKEKEYFFGGLKALYTRCEKCISLEEDYIEK
ncbi:Histone-lysine N-methyltransferase SETMAR [Eumeta japonica]|uniref:Histone-lysine N-methyltransferase SETMAR n=1 Tax=Eumeta variegata TaxID=151549 RepID=A0A4C1UQT3_EUMVA|nr:Histone-lysine N-methyltransferase SETMAR [Eumeta japonica]